MFTRDKIAMMVAEFIGTFVLAAVAIGAAGYFNFTAPWYVSVALGVTLASLVVVLGRASGAHLNPAITIGAWTIKKITLIETFIYLAMQLLGATAALAFVEYTTNNDILQQGFTSIDTRIFVAELVGAAVFGFGVAAALTRKLEIYQSAFIIGSSFMIGILIASIAAPGYINPAIALANNTWDWTVVSAPILGVVAGMNIYNLFIESERDILLSSSTVKTVRKK